MELKLIDTNILTSLFDKILVGALTFVVGWIVKLQQQIGKIPNLELQVEELKKVSAKIQELTDKVSTNDSHIDKRVALTEQVLAEITPLTKHLAVTLTKVTTIVEILMEERKRGD